MSVVTVLAQNSGAFLWPLDQPLTISGNYGEIRPNHFHAGLDFSTRNRIGLPVYSVADGYVSRIRVSPYGYGRCVYVTHPGGKVSLYAHLNSFGLKIDDLVRKEQNQLKNYEVELLPRPNTVLIKAGEIIGMSGNSGGSTGPHLHFEIREQATETPLNALKFYNYPDKVKPVLQGIGLYSLADTCQPLMLSTHRLMVAGDTGYTLPRTLLLGESVIGVSFAGYDKVINSANSNNIYSAKLYVDGKLIYAHELGGIDFADNRYVNEFSDLAAGLKYQKCFVPTLYPKGIHTYHENRGRIVLTDTLFHNIKLLVYDEYGNQTMAFFKIKTTNITDFVKPKLESSLYIDCRKNFTVSKDGITLSVPKGTLYNCTPLVVENNLEISSKLVVFPDVNLRNAATLGFRVPQSEKNPNLIVLRCRGTIYTGALRNDSVLFAVKNFGIFTLLYDSQSPSIIPPKISKKKHHSVKTLSFRISDNLSGISGYQVLINDQWVLAEYDAKSDLLIYNVDDKTPKGKLRINVEVTDKVGNVAKLQYQITR